MEIFVNPIVTVYQLLTIAISLTAIAFIALILFLDRQPIPEPVALPTKR